MSEGQPTERKSKSAFTDNRGDWSELLRIELHPTVARNAGELAEIHELRGFDVIHLASALWLRDRSDENCEFVAFDARLLAGARSAGLETASIGRG